MNSSASSINDTSHHIIGCGDIGRRVAQILLNMPDHDNITVGGWVQTAQSVKQAQLLGIHITAMSVPPERCATKEGNARTPL